MYDAFGKEYLDFAAGIAVNALGIFKAYLAHSTLTAERMVILACSWLMQSFSRFL